MASLSGLVRERERLECDLVVAGHGGALAYALEQRAHVVHTPVQEQQEVEVR